MALRVHTVSEGIHAYLQARSRGGKMDHTTLQYRSRLGYLDRGLGHLKMTYLTRGILFDFLYGPDGELAGASKSRGENHRTAIQGFLTYAGDMGWMPYLRVPSPPHREYEYARDWTYLSADEIKATVKAAKNQRIRLAIAIAANTALRVQDILGIEVRNISLDRGEMKVYIQKSKAWDKKPITYELAGELKDALAEHPGGKYLIPGFRAKGFNTRGGSYEADYSKRASYTWAQKNLKQAYADAGILHDERECWHMIRRSVARRFFDRTMDGGYDHALGLTQAMLNHKNQATTERYLGLRREYEARNASLKGVRFLED